jgi:hypothetical protein
MQAGEEGPDAAESQRLTAPDRVSLEVLPDPWPVRGQRQVVVAPQFVHQPLQGAVGVVEVYSQQARLFRREGTELLLLYPHERLHLLVHDLRCRGP